MKEGDETVISATGSVGGQVGSSTTRGKAGVGIQMGLSKSGSLERRVALREGKYIITITSTEATEGSMGGAFSYAGVGMNVSRTADKLSGESLTFLIDANDPQRNDRLAKILAARSIADLRGVQAGDEDLHSWHTNTAGQGKGGTTSASAGPLALNLLERGDVTEQVTKGPEGVTRVFTGTGMSGASITAGQHTLASGTSADQFRGGAGPDNKGFGETTSTRHETDLGRSAEKLIGSVKKAPLGTIAGVFTGNVPIVRESVNQQGAALTDDSYERLDALARQGQGAWGKAWNGNLATRAAWMAARQKVIDANGDRQIIAKILAEFEGEPGRGRHETVRTAIGSTAIMFEFPDALLDRKPLFDSLVVEDPVLAAQATSDKATALAKLKDANDKLEGLSNTLDQHAKEFERPSDYIEMRQRIDARKRAVRAEIAMLSELDKSDVAQAGPSRATSTKNIPQLADSNAENLPKVQENVERTQEIAEVISRLNSFREIERAVFTAMENEFEGTSLFGYKLPKLSKPDVIALLAQERKLKEAYPKWDQDVALYRKLLEQSGDDVAKAEAFKPNRERYLELDSKVPGRSYGAGLPGYKEI
jgi:hypothetical protein